MRNCKSNYFNTYKFPRQLLLLLISCFLAACNGQNDAKQVLSVENQTAAIVPVININTASVADLEKLPHIGHQTAQNIVEQREKFGRFRKPEHLLLIRGISDKKYLEIRNLITIE